MISKIAIRLISLEIQNSKELFILTKISSFVYLFLRAAHDLESKIDKTESLYFSLSFCVHHKSSYPSRLILLINQ